ncbi:MAG: Fic family protein [Rhodospirillales bacterium]|nr:Fic family protein [Rhodospirillales bacterium]
MVGISGTPYDIDDTLINRLKDITARVSQMRQTGALSPEVLSRLRRFFKIKNIYNSNAIEGNILDIGETRLVVEQGLTITGKPLKDQAEAKNLSIAIDFLEELAKDRSRPITEADIRQLHFLVLKTIRDADAGKYRSVEVEISGSAYKPPAPESIAGQMQEFSAWLSKASVPTTGNEAENAITVATAAHSWFVTIHPFIDGNGRVARLILNLILMRYGFPIAIITKADRSRYYDGLEVSQASDLTAITSLVAECVEESLEEYEVAASEQREHLEWAQSIVGKFQKSERVRASNQYEVWRNAMELLKSVFRQTTEIVNSTASFGGLWFKDFGHIEVEKYLALKTNSSAKRTWFFRVDFKSGNKTARYLFFFGSPSFQMRSRVDVTLFIAREEPAGSYSYERLDNLTAPNVPGFAEIGYDADREEFLVRSRIGHVSGMKVEKICRDFFEDVVQKHFSN